MEWIMKAEQFFAYFHIPEKLDIGFFRRERKALFWFIWLKDSSDVEGWDNFDRSSQGKIWTLTYEDPIGAFNETKANKHC